MTVTEWLLDSDPAIRWQVIQDLLHASPAEVATERARVADEGWGARLLALQRPDGQWAGGTFFPAARVDVENQAWTSTTFTLQLLRNFGVVSSDERVAAAVALVRQNSKWEHDGQNFFDGEVEPCINGMALAVGAYFDQDVRGIADLLLTESLDDGGWNCDAERGSVRSSFHSTICVLEGLLEFENRVGANPELTAAQQRGREYLLDRHLLRRVSDGEIPDERWLEFSFPTRWRYDVLRALDYFRNVGMEADSRMSEAIDLVERKRGPDGRWLLENSQPGDVHFELEDGDGQPSRWNTLRALRVLEWAGR